MAGTVGWTPRALADGPAPATPPAPATASAPAATVAPATPEATQPHPPARTSDGPAGTHRDLRTLAWASVAIGSVAGLVAFGTSGLILYQKGVRDDNCDAQKVCTARGFAATQTIQTLVPWNTGSWIAAAVGVGAGVGLWFASRDDRKQTAISLSPAPGGLAIGLRSTF
jgi:hypothetical protein